MFQLFNPIALVATASVIVPVLIHLWNKRKGKTLKVGSITLLTENNKTTSRYIRITEWPLLLLRCLLLLLIATLLAKPFWQNKPGKNKGGWIMVRDYELAAVYNQQQTLIDSLTKQGFELRNFSSQTNPLSLSDTLNYTLPDQPTPGYWPLIKYLDATLPGDFTVYIISDLSVVNFAGKRPSTQLDLHWINIDQPVKADTSITGSFINTDGQPMLMHKISTTTGNYYETAAAPPPITTEKNSNINISIHAGINTADAKYLRAALEAISAYTGRTILINGSTHADSQQVIFWLQDQEPDEKIIHSLVSGGVLFRYANLDSSLSKIPSPANTGSSIFDGRDPDRFYQYASNSSTRTSLWTLANGEPVLSAETKAGKKIIYFNSRFNPQWTDIVWNGSLARLLLPIVIPMLDSTGTDLRKMSTEQSAPHHVNKKQNGRLDDAGFLHKQDLSFILWTAAFLVFALERIIAHRQTKQKNA
ncbi:MAG: BatA domain-containing protein [Chitinophagaceae bacterium]|nr:BatA domain-containing protein [Chitinophagaceae bacterium]